MSFLVRKLNKRDYLDGLLQNDNVEDIFADVPTNEFRTTKGTLSTWIIDSIEELDNAVLAIAVSSSKITKMDFIVIDTKLLDEARLEYKQTYAGIEILIVDLQDTHYDIMDISLKKLVDCARVYKAIFLNEDQNEEKYIVRFTEVEIKEKLKKAILSNRVDKSKASKHIKEVIEKLSAA